MINFDRRCGIGASDIGAIVGVSPFATAVDLWNEKRSENNILSRPTLRMRMGLAEEPYILADYAELTNSNVIYDNESVFFHKTIPFMYCHVDGYVKNDDGSIRIVEAKLIQHTDTQQQFGEQWTDQIPLHYLLQCAYQAIVISSAISPVERVDLAARIGEDIKVYTYNRNSALEKLIIDRAGDFWTRCVVGAEAPEPQSYEDLRYIYKTAKKDSNICASGDVIGLVYNLINKNNEIKILEQTLMEIKKEICEYMKTSDTLTDNTGKVLAKWCNQSRKSVDQKLLKNKYPDIYDEVVKSIDFRVFRC